MDCNKLVQNITPCFCAFEKIFQILVLIFMGGLPEVKGKYFILAL